LSRSPRYLTVRRLCNGCLEPFILSGAMQYILHARKPCINIKLIVVIIERTLLLMHPFIYRVIVSICTNAMAPGVSLRDARRMPILTGVMLPRD
jgi:hypothetical protein